MSKTVPYTWFMNSTKNSENSRPEDHPAERPAMRLSGKTFVVVGVVLAVIISFAGAYTRFVLGPDKQNVFVRGLFEHVGEYVQVHHGQWPKSWDDLEALPVENKWYLPLDWEKARESVEIEFDADPEVISRQMPNEFTAIRAKKPVLDYRSDPRVSTLIEITRRELAKSSQATH